jgi:hypothetical protein
MVVRPHSAHWLFTGLAWLLMPAAAHTAEFFAASVEFAPGYEAALRAKYGAPEAPALRSEIVDSISAALKAAHGDCILNMDVVMERVAPTHPTMKQQLDDPAMDPFRSVFLNGGAALTGHVLGADGQVLATVKHEHFVDDLRSVSPGKDPWSDARVAIGQFTDTLVGACRRQSSASNPPR